MESNTRVDLLSKLTSTKKIGHHKTIIQNTSRLHGELFKRGLTTPLLKYLNSQQADYVMREIHEGIYGLHTGGRSLATKVVQVPQV
ncbi:hypothetical protein JHK87_001073 [Glycine soja]|nr:hypothetical protein JHK87_001073 [Glycine soja]